MILVLKTSKTLIVRSCGIVHHSFIQFHTELY